MLKAHEGQRPIVVTLPIKVQTYDIDFAGHVNNGVYIRWLEDLRMELLRQFYPIDQLVADGVFPVLHATNIVYKRSIGIMDVPVGQMWCTEMGRATLRLEAEITVNGAVCAHAVQRAIFLKLGGTAPARIPAPILEAFRASLES